MALEQEASILNIAQLYQAVVDRVVNNVYPDNEDMRKDLKQRWIERIQVYGTATGDYQVSQRVSSSATETPSLRTVLPTAETLPESSFQAVAGRPAPFMKKPFKSLKAVEKATEDANAEKAKPVAPQPYKRLKPNIFSQAAAAAVVDSGDDSSDDQEDRVFPMASLSAQYTSFKKKAGKKTQRTCRLRHGILQLPIEATSEDTVRENQLVYVNTVAVGYSSKRPWEKARVVKVDPSVVVAFERDESKQEYPVDLTGLLLPKDFLVARCEGSLDFSRT